MRVKMERLGGFTVAATVTTSKEARIERRQSVMMVTCFAAKETSPLLPVAA
jgi:hypothetical protein